jgi:hypothetical protein
LISLRRFLENQVRRLGSTPGRLAQAQSLRMVIDLHLPAQRGCAGCRSGSGVADPERCETLRALAMEFEHHLEFDTTWEYPTPPGSVLFDADPPVADP